MKKLIFGVAVILIAACIAIAGCTGNGTESQTGEGAKDGDTVAVYYSLIVDGEEVESNVNSEPIEFVLGSGAMIPGFDKAVHGMKVGDKTTVTLPPEEAYGMPTKDNLQVFNLSDAQSVVGEIKVGDILTMANGYLGEVMFIYPEENAMALALNHPMAGKTLTFVISLASIS